VRISVRAGPGDHDLGRLRAGRPGLRQLLQPAWQLDRQDHQCQESRDRGVREKFEDTIVVVKRVSGLPRARYRALMQNLNRPREGAY